MATTDTRSGEQLLSAADHVGETTALSIPEAGAVWFDSTRAMHEAAGRLIRRDEPLPDLLRSELHERTHLIHRTTTPMGVYIQRLALVQTEQVVAILEALVRAGAPIRTPLMDHVQTIDGPLAERIRYPVMAWLAAERIRLELIGVAPKLTEFAVRFPEAAEWPHVVIERIAAVEMWRLIDRPEHVTTPDVDAIWDPARLGPKERLGAVRFAEQRAHQLVAAPPLTAILESTAFVTEFVGSDRLPSVPLLAGGPHDADAPYVRLIGVLREHAHGMGSADAMTTILTMRAVAEIVLFAPVLHEFREVAPMDDTVGFAPLTRWLRVIRSESFRPVRRVEDFPRFCADVCGELGIPTPLELAARADAFRRQKVFDPVRSRFAHSLDARRMKPWIYLNPLIGAEPGDPVDEAWLRTVEYDHVFFRDTEWHRPTSPVSRWQFHAFLYDTWIRQLALSAPHAIWLPFAMSDSDRAGAVDELRRHLGEDLSVAVAAPTIAFRAPAFGHV